MGMGESEDVDSLEQYSVVNQLRMCEPLMAHETLANHRCSYPKILEGRKLGVCFQQMQYKNGLLQTRILGILPHCLKIIKPPKIKINKGTISLLICILLRNEI